METTSICYICKEECNPHSQACSSCMRSLVIREYLPTEEDISLTGYNTRKRCSPTGSTKLNTAHKKKVKTQVKSSTK